MSENKPDDLSRDILKEAEDSYNLALELHLQTKLSAADKLLIIDLIEDAADKGLKSAQRFLGLGLINGDLWDKDFYEGIKCLETSVDPTNPERMYEIAWLCEKGEHDPQLAAKWYERAASLAYKPAMFRLALMYEKGIGVTKNHKKAFSLLRQVVLINDYRYQMTISRYYYDHIGTKKNNLEAYIWSLIAQAKSLPNTRLAYFDELEGSLSEDERSIAQDEAERRFRILEQRELTETDLLEFNPEPPVVTKVAPSAATVQDEISHIKPEPADDPAPDPGLPALLKDWKVAGVSSLTIHVNLREKTVRIVHSRKSKTLTNADFARLFTRYALPLIVDHHESQRSSKPKVDYASPSLARGVDLTLTRPNHKTVSDVNSRIRSVFGLGKKEQAFKWISANRHDTKTLKANIKIEVHYLK
ncbi:MAG: sel1 repeat family protein [Candidatus Cloacimonetes bacterium]|nr:sel1 repeat family protein [Candidatus Cloacimonadota bacterium]MDY0366977.1 tetratricopeptide repeat protein [Candidatus Syntrophosphaera sp.]